MQSLYIRSVHLFQNSDTLYPRCLKILLRTNCRKFLFSSNFYWRSERFAIVNTVSCLLAKFVISSESPLQFVTNWSFEHSNHSFSATVESWDIVSIVAHEINDLVFFMRVVRAWLPSFIALLVAISLGLAPAVQPSLLILCAKNAPWTLDVDSLYFYSFLVYFR